MVLARAVGVALSLAACAVGGSGCSILFAHGPPERLEPHAPIRCTRSYALPVLDGIITALQVVRTAYAFSLSDQDYDHSASGLNRPADIGIGLGLSTLFGVSTGIGIGRVGDCNALLEKTERRPEPLRTRPANPFAPPPPSVDTDADAARAGAAAAEEAKAAGEAAGAAQRKK